MCACSVVACQLKQIHFSQQWLCNRLNLYLLSRFLLLLFFFNGDRTDCSRWSRIYRRSLVNWLFLGLFQKIMKITFLVFFGFWWCKNCYTLWKYWTSALVGTTNHKLHSSGGHLCKWLECWETRVPQTVVVGFSTYIVLVVLCPLWVVDFSWWRHSDSLEPVDWVF